MSTSIDTARLTTARVLMPPGSLPSRSNEARTLRALIWARSITQSELSEFINKFGFGPNGRTERYDGTRSDGVIELERTVLNVRTHDQMLQEACVFAYQVEKHFKRITEVTVH